MTYMQGYVVAILKDGKPLRQQGDNVYLPFGSEYSILLKNKTSNRVCADVYIDGAKANTSSYVIEPFGKTEIKRFMLDGDLNAGAAFKFTKADEQSEVDASHKDAGVVEVRIYQEVNYWTGFGYQRPDFGWIRKSPSVADHTYRSTFSCSTIGSNMVVNSVESDASGVTAQGKIVHQDFTPVEWKGTNTLSEFVIRIKLLPIKDQISPTPQRSWCTTCGIKLVDEWRFCSNCGSKI